MLAPDRDEVNGMTVVVMPDAHMKLPVTNKPPPLSKENPHKNLEQRLSTRLKNSNSTGEVVATAAAISEETLASVLKSDDKCSTSKEENYMLKEILSRKQYKKPWGSIATHLEMSAVSLERHYQNLLMWKREGDREAETK